MRIPYTRTVPILKFTSDGYFPAHIVLMDGLSETRDFYDDVHICTTKKKKVVRNHKVFTDYILFITHEGIR